MDNEFVSQLHLLAWAKGLKSLYYIRSQAASENLATKIVDASASLKQTVKTDDITECFYCG